MNFYSYPLDCELVALLEDDSGMEVTSLDFCDFARKIRRV